MHKQDVSGSQTLNVVESNAVSCGSCLCMFSVKRALDRELQALDLQVGRQLVMTNPHWANKDLEELLT